MEREERELILPNMAPHIAWTILLTTVASAAADEIHGYFVDIQQGLPDTDININKYIKF